MAGKINQRRNLRVYCGAPARVEGPRGPVKGICRNLSVGGLFFVGAALPPGRQTELTIELPEVGKVVATCEVRYHHEYPEGAGMGIRFTRITQEDLARVSHWVQSHPSP